ncbi:hypothetical protein AABD41_01280 [Staphylococcus pseudoxylosus]|uniref:hypothetical protein n=1 Tax=Staphylococcus pseudoxylosus TaxID=2282419 RepID=UPI00398AD2A1
MNNNENIDELKYTLERRELKINKLLNNITHQADVISELEVENELLKATIDQINKTNETQG